MGLSPDSYYHLEVSRAYSTTLTIPPNTPDTYKWRDITHIAYLYFWINGRVLNINNGFFNEIILLRILNVIYSFGTVLITYLLSKEILKGKWLRLLPTFLLVNTIMFVFLSSSINYDNLANLFSVLSIYMFVKFVKSKLDIKYIYLMLIFLCLGTLTKYTILPLAFILVLLSILHIYIERKKIKNIEFRKGYLYIVPILILAVLNIQLYGTNILKYGGLEPKCDQVLTHEQCLTNGVYYRDMITIPGIEVEGMGHIFKMIVNGERETPIIYFGYWIYNIIGKVHGIMGDNSMPITDAMKVLYLLFLSTGIYLGINNYKKWKLLDIYLIVIFFSYASILFFAQNYKMYLKHDHMFLALQGRYLFPVISTGYIIYSKSLSFIKSKRIFYSFLILLLLLFVLGCIPFFFLNVESHWFNINF